tara:strand:+ start:19025 stop:19492 length:468 start_codon:yes stop_codon:yes gene_type:complete
MIMTEQKQLKANNFEDIVYDYFNDELNWILSHYASKEAQFKRGENRQGVEIKNDQRYNETGNLFISIKRDYKFKEYPSGIFRDTETKQLFYVIGDKDNFWVLSTKHLREYFNIKNPDLFSGFTTDKGGKEYGFLLPINKADRICVHKFSNQTTLL